MCDEIDNEFLVDEYDESLERRKAEFRRQQQVAALKALGLKQELKQEMLEAA